MKTCRTIRLETEVKEGTIFNNELIIKTSENSFTTISKRTFLPIIQKRIYIFDREEWPGKCHEQLPFRHNYTPLSGEYIKLNHKLK